MITSLYSARQSFLTSPRIVLFAAFSITALITYVDLYTGSEMAFSLFYFVPISITVWYVGRKSGLLFALLSAATWFYADLNGGRSYSEWWIPFWNTGIRLCVFIVMVSLLAQIKQLLHEKEIQAITDPLTHLLNRRVFLEKVEQESRRSRRYGGFYTIVYIDLDNFKWVNDQLGHHMGDKLLVNVAEALKNNLRSTDLSARLGGDEFALLMPHTQEETVMDVLNKLRNELQKSMNDNQWPVTFSIGAATYNKPELETSELLRLTDQLMYRVKKSSKDAIAHESY